jgi:N-acyl-D-aspartate/D-glutamate deacylase
LSEIDVDIYASETWMATASDAGIALPGDGFVHARFYGTFPRKVRRYAMERGRLSVESAIRSATSLPAQILGFRNRGLVREGFYADLVVLDLDAFRDTATFFEPHQYAEGVAHVLVGGAFVVEDGALTWALPGVVITPREGREPPTIAP